MISQYSFSNYKAFAEGAIELKPITIFLGGNSSGKSSVARLPILLRQTAMRNTTPVDDTYRRFFNYNSSDGVEFGEAQSLLQRKHAHEPLDISVTISVSDAFKTQRDDLCDRYIDFIWERFRTYAIVTQQKSQFAILKLGEMLAERKKTSIRQNLLSLLLSEISNTRFITDDSNENLDPIDYLRYNSATSRLVKRNTTSGHRQFKPILELLTALVNLKFESLQYSYKLKYNKTLGDFACANLNIFSTNVNVFSISFRASRATLFGQSINFNEGKEKLFLPDSLQDFFHISASQSISSIDLDTKPLLSLQAELLNLFMSEFKSSFSSDNIEYVPPLRDHPQRYYHRRQKALDNVGLSHYQAGHLLQERPDLLSRVNKWFSAFQTNFSVDESSMDILTIHAFRQNSDTRMPLSDIGFGISQVMPVVVQSFLAPKGSTIFIEQPEVHLHPNMQSNLADMFLEAINTTPNKTFVIETHSQALMYRLRRRIAEGVIPASSVAVYGFSVDSDGAGTIMPIKVDERGEIDWPMEFVESQMADIDAFSRAYIQSARGHLPSEAE